MCSDKIERVFEDGTQEEISIDDIYANIGQAVAANLEDVDWEEAVLHIDIPALNTISYELFYKKSGTIRVCKKEMEFYPDDFAVSDLHEFMLDGKNSWNKAVFKLNNEGDFSMDFNWNEPELFIALKNKDFDKIVSLIQNDADVDVVDKKGLTFTQHIMKADVPQNIKELVKKVSFAEDEYTEVESVFINSEINTPDVFGETPLLKAVKKGQITEVKNLLSSGADPDFVNKFNETVLLSAVKKGYMEIVKLLIQAGANINYRDSFGKTALDYAKQKGFHEIEEILKLAGVK